MSNSSRTDRSIVPGDVSSVAVLPAIREPLQGVAFWTAITLPFLYVPLLATGLETMRIAVAFVVLLAVNVVTLMVGHPYHRD